MLGNSLRAIAHLNTPSSSLREAHSSHTARAARQGFISVLEGRTCDGPSAEGDEVGRKNGRPVVPTEFAHSLCTVGVFRRYHGRFSRRKSLILWCREGESNPQGPKVGGF